MYFGRTVISLCQQGAKLANLKEKREERPSQVALIVVFAKGFSRQRLRYSKCKSLSLLFCRRIQEILPQRMAEWKKTPSYADAKAEETLKELAKKKQV